MLYRQPHVSGGPAAGGGGGGGGAIVEESGGGAGLPGGGAGAPGDPCAAACGGTRGSQATFGTGGAADRASCSTCTAGSNGAEFTSTGPGLGGAGGTANIGQGGGGGGAGYYGGGGGGAGYYGGGGGGGARTNAGGGGGGSDFCASTLTHASLSGCGATGTNSTFETASVALSYCQPVWAHDFRDLVVDSRGVGPGDTLVHKVRLAKSKYTAGDVSGACRTLDGYMREVNKQTGTTVTKAQAHDLIEDARETQKAIGCSRS